MSAIRVCPSSRISGLKHRRATGCSVRPGKLADLVITRQNPLANFKILYGTGHFGLNAENQPARSAEVLYTIKNGVVYDAGELLSDVREMVRVARAERNEPEDGPVRQPYIPQ